MTKCPCCSGESFANCCQPVISGNTPAATAEKLMRSRFSAYAICDAQYLLDTYTHKQQAELSVEDLAQWAKENIWVKLTIHEHLPMTPPAQVEFSAFYINNDRLYEMRERSNFIKEDSLWRYLDGDIIKHENISTIKRNDSCPCLSGKKYKKCCGK